MRTNTAESATAIPKKLNELTDMLIPLAIDSERTYWKMLKWIDELAVLDKWTKDQGRFLETLTIFERDPLKPRTDTGLHDLGTLSKKLFP